MKHRKSQLVAAFMALAFLGVAVARISASPIPPAEKPDAEPWRRIEKVVDGDTVRLDGGETVRLLGVDTPESSANRKLRRDLEKMRTDFDKAEMLALGVEAAQFVRVLAENRRCWLEYEARHTDMYGRTLAYVHLDNGIILNEIIIAEGYGRAYLDQPFRYKRRYIELQRAALENRRGLWAHEDFAVLSKGTP